MNKLFPFHLAISVNNLESCRLYYREILGCKEGRSSDDWVDFDFFGHQLVIHLDKNKSVSLNSNPVDGKEVPVPHFGIILEWKVFNDFVEFLTNKQIKFIIKPHTRFKGLAG